MTGAQLAAGSVSARAHADAYVAAVDAGSPQGWGWGASDEQTDHCKRLRDLCDCTPLDTDAVEALVREHEGAASEPNRRRCTCSAKTPP